MRSAAWILAVVAMVGCEAEGAKEEPAAAAEPESEPPAAKAEPKPAPPKVDAWATNAAQLLDEAKRARGLAGLKKLLAAGSSPRFGEAVVPAIVKIWPDAPKYHLPILELLRDAADPAAAPVWNLALAGDLSDETENEWALALDGVAASRASGSVDAVATRLGALLDDPSRDAGTHAGARRLRLVKVLGEVGDHKGTPVLMRVLEQPITDQPVAMHRAATTALGHLRDPAAVDALLTITFRVPDMASTTNVGERSKQALASIGAAAVPGALKVLRGKHEGVRKLVKKHGLDSSIEVLAAAGVLGAIGHPDAVDPLLAAMPTTGCEGGAPGEDAPVTRGVLATALGFIGDPRAVGPLCKCAKASRDPADMYPIAEALGRIGGSDAVTCLADVIRTGAYDGSMVASLDFAHEIRWEAARFGLLAADASQLETIEDAVTAAAKDKRVAEKVADWKPGFEAAAECEDDLKCWKTKLGDVSQPWIVREKAAFMVARASKGNAAVALELAEAFSVRNPDARTSIAWLTAATLGHGATRCQACATKIADTMERDKGGLPATYQLSVLTARVTVAKLRE